MCGKLEFIKMFVEWWGGFEKTGSRMYSGNMSSAQDDGVTCAVLILYGILKAVLPAWNCLKRLRIIFTADVLYIMTKRMLKTLGVIGNMRLFVGGLSLMGCISTKILYRADIVIINSVNKT